jgi:TPP-dependent pyruvate/acetoin dehydrogenase alpha subunit
MNVLAVYEATRQAVARARGGHGPTFIEAPCYRYRAHGGSGDDTKTGYRDLDERAAWDEVDPVALHAQYLIETSVLTEAQVSAMRSEIADEIAEAFAHAIASPNPTEADLSRHIYAD